MYYTSYFGKIKKLDKNKFKLVSITASKPSFCGDEIGDWSFLGPPLTLLKSYKQGQVTEREYTQIYLNHIIKIWPQISNFIEENADKNVVMLCYEKSENFCHRHLLRTFLNTKGIECKEVDDNDI